MDAAHVGSARLRDNERPGCEVVPNLRLDHALQGANQPLAGTVGGGVEHCGGDMLDVEPLHQGMEVSLVFCATVCGPLARVCSARSSVRRLLLLRLPRCGLRQL